MEMRMKARWVAAGVVWALCVPFRTAAQDVINGPGRYQFRNFASGSTKGRIPDLSQLWKTPWKKVFDVYGYDQTNAIPFSSRPAGYPVWDIQSATFDYHVSGKPAAGPPVPPIPPPPASRSCPD
jgi:hypothetical protein